MSLRETLAYAHALRRQGVADPSTWSNSMANWRMQFCASLWQVSVCRWHCI